MIESITDNYKESFVAFLDVLGFKNMVMDGDNTKLTTYFNEVKSVIEELKKISEKKDIGYIVISDSIILTIEKDNYLNGNAFILRQLCIAVRKIQKKLALNNIWLRGAISSGKTFFDQDNNQIVGPAYIKAYQLEGELAMYPRVILDNRIINDLKIDNSNEFIKKINDEKNDSDIALYDWSKNKLVTDFTIEQDILFFIDYLYDVFNNINEFNIIYDNIKNNLYSNSIITKKFRWITNYLYTVALRSENRNLSNLNEYKDMLKKI